MRTEREPSPYLADDIYEEADRNEWSWRKCRCVGFGVELWPSMWWPFITVDRGDDRFGGCMVLGIGPINFVFHYNVGDKDNTNA